MDRTIERLLQELAAAIDSYRQCERSDSITRRVEAWLQLYVAFGEPLGQRGMCYWLQYETWTTRN